MACGNHSVGGAFAAWPSRGGARPWARPWMKQGVETGQIRRRSALGRSGAGLVVSTRGVAAVGLGRGAVVVLLG